MSEAQYLSKHYYTQDFLPPAFNRAILDSLSEGISAFEDATVFSHDHGGGGHVLSDNRVAKTATLQPEIRKQFKGAIRAILPEVVPQIGLAMRDDFSFEIGAALHQDGGFFKRHIDTRTKMPDETDRYISAVYYMCRMPQRFTGGQFRLHSLIGGGYQDFEATNNALMVFPSFAPHEVLPISVPSGRAEDGRFSINCWVRIPRPGA
ncbi:2OG-Fe(II) oxygenase [Rhodobacteraceae bacterium N5(2021)]|uniref:2OG-Fe(II) oxygenase n=1 Tax=Gymnodinialimonas phycosphaerae TaxID=2841589 RepID=A0A975YER5_9RHOB|nr:2OG-Fe(II) oxygenase [Gymnodinialimonas phycosphaerae]MBY4893893.1 2OG-Fe(II) oxygenase [Gymnodinialimonas phycosphaerae]